MNGHVCTLRPDDVVAVAATQGRRDAEPGQPPAREMSTQSCRLMHIKSMIVGHPAIHPRIAVALCTILSSEVH